MQTYGSFLKKKKREDKAQFYIFTEPTKRLEVLAYCKKDPQDYKKKKKRLLAYVLKCMFLFLFFNLLFTSLSTFSYLIAAW